MFVFAFVFHICVHVHYYPRSCKLPCLRYRISLQPHAVLDDRASRHHCTRQRRLPPRRGQLEARVEQSVLLGSGRRSLQGRLLDHGDAAGKPLWSHHHRVRPRVVGCNTRMQGRAASSTFVCSIEFACLFACRPNWQLQAIITALSTGPNGPSDMVSISLSPALCVRILCVPLV